MPLFILFGVKKYGNTWKTIGKPPKTIHETKGSINGNFQKARADRRRNIRVPPCPGVSASYV
jgi:hypothetical protein